MGKYQIPIIFLSLLTLVLALQNCSNNSEFAAIADSDGILNPNKTIVIGPPRPPGEPRKPGDGLVGKIYYLLNDSGSKDLSAQGFPDTMKDKNGVDVLFPESVSSVNFMIARGIQLEETVIMDQVFIPTFRFADGFTKLNGKIVKDQLGNSIIEAFAFELEGSLTKGNAMQEGWHEMALLSDDGATLEGDLDGNGTYETMLINNDGLHATKLKCSTFAVDFNNSTKIPIRLRYYQGPRHHIALNLLFRKIDNESDAAQDPRCDYEPVEADEWFNTYGNKSADLVNSEYGELVSRGWFPGEFSSLSNEVSQ